MPSETILIVDDEQLIRWSLGRALQKEGYNVIEAEDTKRALSIIITAEPDLIVLDQRLPDGSGIELLQRLHDKGMTTPTIMLTAIDRSDVAVQAMKLGALDYITKPVNIEELKIVVDKCLEATRLRRQLHHFKKENEKRFGSYKLIGDSPAMQTVFEQISKIAQSSATTVLLTGESGTGKELAARAVHMLSDRQDMPFLAVNCSALIETLIESELFGHEKGAFTDARMLRKGMFELAQGGAVFLDEIGDTSPAVQARLLRVLEERIVRRVGGSADICVDVRIIAATNRSLEQRIAEEKFRTDLFYRLNVAHIHLPPVRERGDDVILLAEFFLNEFNIKFRKHFKGLSEKTKTLFRQYAWPGNVREIRNVVERAALLDDGEYIFSHDVHLGHLHQLHDQKVTTVEFGPDGLSLMELEKKALLAALSRTDGNQSQAAKLLKISRDALRYKMKKFGLPKQQHDGE
ncbi:MAG: sigma-54-dependent Fis family transcriptional regulator [Ignavibacteriae bacterium]|nr:sigma-54-dependent Fis family transcriptional regulator [Ignavibacteriota bacterium]